MPALRPSPWLYFVYDLVVIGLLAYLVVWRTAAWTPGASPP